MRKRLTIRKIMDDQEHRIDAKDSIAEVAVTYYQNLFSDDNKRYSQAVLNFLRRCVTEDDN